MSTAPLPTENCPTQTTDTSTGPALDQLFELMENERYGVEYQPIISTNDDLLGYEALARFTNASGQTMRPDRVFEALHDHPLCLLRVEQRLKELQTRYAPADGLLFLNIDQDAYALAAQAGKDILPLEAHNRQRLVVEIIENSNIVDARISDTMVRDFRAANLSLALDDVGARNSLLAVEVLAEVDYVKLAREWLLRMESATYRSLLNALIGFCRDTGKRTILEGVETKEQLNLARRLGVDYVQGFLFRADFQSIPPARRTFHPETAASNDTGLTSLS